VQKIKSLQIKLFESNIFLSNHGKSSIFFPKTSKIRHFFSKIIENQAFFSQNRKHTKSNIEHFSLKIMENQAFFSQKNIVKLNIFLSPLKKKKPYIIAPLSCPLSLSLATLSLSPVPLSLSCLLI